MPYQTTTSQVLRKDIAKTSGVLRSLQMTRTGQNQRLGAGYTRVSSDTVANTGVYERARYDITNDLRSDWWSKQLVEILVQSEAQPLTTDNVLWHPRVQTHGENSQIQRISWKEQIASATRHEEVIAILRYFGLDAIANRLGYLHRVAADDPENETMVVGSMQELALFLMSERQLPDPQIGLSVAGLLQVEWRLPNHGILAMEFLPSRLIRFAAVSAPATHGVHRMTVNGTLRKDATLKAVEEFTSTLIRDGWKSAS